MHFALATGRQPCEISQFLKKSGYSSRSAGSQVERLATGRYFVVSRHCGTCNSDRSENRGIRRGESDRALRKWIGEHRDHRGPDLTFVVGRARDCVVARTQGGHVKRKAPRGGPGSELKRA